MKAKGCYVRVENIGDSKRRSSSRDEESEAEVVSPPKKRGRKAGSKKKTRGKPKIVTVEEEECDKNGEMIWIRQRWSMRNHIRKCKKADKFLCTF